MDPVKTLDNDDPSDPPVPPAHPARVDQRTGKTSIWEHPAWRNLWMPLLTNTVPIAVATLSIGLIIKSTENEDRVRSFGIAAQIEIIRSDHTQLRDLSARMRRIHRETDEAVVGRANGTATAAVPDRILSVFAELDDALHFAATFHNRSTTPAENEDYKSQILNARMFARALHDCLAPMPVTQDVRTKCSHAVATYRNAAKVTEPSLALHLIDEAVLALRRQLAR